MKKKMYLFEKADSEMNSLLARAKKTGRERTVSGLIMIGATTYIDPVDGTISTIWGDFEENYKYSLKLHKLAPGWFNFTGSTRTIRKLLVENPDWLVGVYARQRLRLYKR